jgi:hypothetical protein
MTDQKIYVIELERWGIDGNPEKNSTGISQALVWASENGYTTITFPSQEYVISENSPVIIKDMKDITIDFNGAVLQMNTNDLRSNKIVMMYDCRNVKLIDGTISGDIDTHDYDTNPGTTEGNIGLLLEGGVIDCQLDNMTIKDLPGWGIVISKGPNHVSRKQFLSKKNLELGGINLETGVKNSDNTRIRTTAPIDLAEFQAFEDRFFILCYDLAYMGNPYLKTWDFDAVFYDSSHQRISTAPDQRVYRKTALPEGAMFVDIILHQSELPTYGDAVSYFTYFVQVEKLQITNCIFDRNKSLGLAVCSGDQILVKNCTFKNHGGLAPGYAIDIEEGWDFTTDVHIIDNVFENNPGDLVVCTGDRMVVSGNQFWGNVAVWARASNYRIENNQISDSHAWSSRLVQYEFSGDSIIRGNTYTERSIGVNASNRAGTLVFENETLLNAAATIKQEGVALVNSQLTVTPDFDKSLFAGGTYQNCTIDVKKLYLNNAKLEDCTINDCQLDFQYAPVSLERCKINHVQLASNAGVSSLTIKESIITDSWIQFNTWSPQAAILDFQDNRVLMTAAHTQAFIRLSAGKAKDFTIAGNTITNESSQPVFDMFDTTYSIPAGKLLLEKNTFIQRGHKYIFTGKKINSGIVYFTAYNNQIQGDAEIIDPIYRNNAHVVIDEKNVCNSVERASLILEYLDGTIEEWEFYKK